MIVVKVELWSAITGVQSNLGTMVIDNIATNATGKKADYRCRMYRKSAKDLRTQYATEKPTREAQVLGHNRIAEPVHNLVAKALTAMGYE